MNNGAASASCCGGLAMLLPSYLATVCRFGPGMPLVRTLAVLLAMSLWGTWGFTPAALAAGPEQVPQRPVTQRPAASATIEQTTGIRAQLADNSWQQTAILAARQGMGAVGLLAKRTRRQTALPAEPVRELDAETDEPPRPTQAWLSIEGEAAGKHRFAGEMIRIGRHPDNEVWLRENSVHSYHAVIHRTEDAGFFITDLSGQEGSGVRINGTRCARSRLANGDVIELGKARITFAMAAN